MTKLDGDARGGAALSVRAVTGAPILFAGTGEKLDALEVFHPDRMATRILGMGDVLTLIEKAEQAYDEKEALQLQRKLRRNEFTLEDFRDQLRAVRKMGAIGDLLDMIPGMKKLTKGIDMASAETELKRIEAIINSMTREERDNAAIINGSRRRRIAAGSGTTRRRREPFPQAVPADQEDDEAHGAASPEGACRQGYRVDCHNPRRGVENTPWLQPFVSPVTAARKVPSTASSSPTAATRAMGVGWSRWASTIRGRSRRASSSSAERLAEWLQARRAAERDGGAADQEERRATRA